MKISTDLRRQGISFSGYAISTSMAQLMVMLFSLLLARYFGPEISGGYTSAFVIASLTAIAFNLGLDTWVLRAGALAQDIQKTYGNILKIKATTEGAVAGNPEIISPSKDSCLLLQNALLG